ncbi:hypothetical protein DPMN_149492 [Dreissena polymorpha]|uniref:Uncharacterized protein n=1 Tax=Dreissena polymorpha TaxID=45954 RepID=A0A9D4FG26_DREPO|nr:hypothetical protein DPMN_149492 [Dreissena polymorpha]
MRSRFLELSRYVLVVYRDEALSGTELTSKLEQAFLGGLRCSQPAIRHKFVEVFNASIPRRVFDRLLYITCSQNWEAMGAHFWIKQCIEVGTMTGLLSRAGCILVMELFAYGTYRSKQLCNPMIESSNHHFYCLHIWLKL